MERQDRLLCSRSEQWEQRVTFKLYQVFDFRFASDFQRLLIASSASSIFQYFHFEIVSHFRFASDFNFAPSAAHAAPASVTLHYVPGKSFRFTPDSFHSLPLRRRSEASSR